MKSRSLLQLLMAGMMTLCMAGQVWAADPLKNLSLKLAEAMKGEMNKKVAVLSLPYHDGAVSKGSTIIAERMTTYLVQSGKVEVIERHLIDKVLSEAKLSDMGILNEESAQKIGTLVGAGAIVCGTLIDISKDKTEINARIISAQSGKILVAGNTKVKRDWDDSPVMPVVVTPPAAATPPVTATTPPATDTPAGKGPLVQLAILLDTSNSMDGLINQAKSQLWKIVNELASARRHSANPTIQVALFEYGNNNLSAGENYIRQVLPFTTDLDAVSEKLFILKTNGGSEFCGTVIQDAVTNLAWSKDEDTYKAIFIAGNEPFTQGPVDFRSAVERAAGKGIIVNTIFCGSREEGISTMWRDGALAGRGDYMNIDSDREIVTVSTPYDDEITSLSTRLNSTYIGYGARGYEMQNNQLKQDANSALFSKSAAPLERAKFKANAQYQQAAESWDAVSQVQSGRKVSELKKEDLPRELQGKSQKELDELFANKIKERKEIQEKITKLSGQRDAYITKARKDSAASTLDTAIITAVRTQAQKKKFTFEKK